MSEKGSPRVKIGFSTIKLGIYQSSRTPYGYYCAIASTESMFRSDESTATEHHRVGDGDDDRSSDDAGHLARAESGGSYRTIQRFYNSAIPWGMVLWLFFKAHFYEPGTEYLLVGDESVVTKAGKQAHGLDRFFSSIFNKPGSLGFRVTGINLGR